MVQREWAGSLVVDAVNESIPQLAQLLGDPDPRVRSSACEVLGSFSQGCELLLQRLGTERDELPTASALVALSIDTASSERARPFIERRLEDERASVRLAAWIAASRLNLDAARRLTSQVAPFLRADEFPWQFAGRSSSTLLANLAAPIRAQTRLEVARWLADDLSTSEQPTVAQKCEWPRLILFLAGMRVDFSHDPRGYDQSPRMRLPEEVTDEQRELLLKLNDADLRFAGADVPWDPLTRQRWLGAASVTALEKRTPSPSNGHKLPVWRVWQELIGASGAASHHLPEQLRPHLTSAERVEALLLASRDAYGLKGRWSDEERQLVFAWSNEDVAESVAVASRFLNDNPPQTSERAVAVRILIRAKQPMRPEWEPYALTMVKNLKRIDLELLEAIPPERREPIALQGAVDLTGIEQVPQVLRLVPTEAVADRFLAAIGRFAGGAKGETKRRFTAARKGIEAVAAEHPPLQAVLAKHR